MYFIVFAVDIRDVPDYYTVIKQHMDFFTIRQKLEVRFRKIKTYVFLLSMILV